MTILDLKCPFCHAKLQPMLSQNILYCGTCDLVVEPSRREAHFANKAPMYYQESQKFLQLFVLADPVFVLSKYKLFDENFTLDTVEFYNVPANNLERFQKNPDSKRIKLPQSNSKLRKDYHIIAGRKNLTHQLIGDLMNALRFKSENNALVREKVPEYNKLLWLDVVKATDTHEKDFRALPYNEYRVIQAYLNPTTEGMIACLFNILGEPKPIDDEAAMYAFVMNRPDLNIGWANTYAGLYYRIVRYLNAVTSDVPAYDDCTNHKIDLCLDTEEKQLFFNDALAKSYLLSMPSTAVNEQDKGENEVGCCYDIMNNEFAMEPIPDTLHNIQTKHLVSLFSTYKILDSMWNEFAKGVSNYGVEVKRDYLVKECRKPRYLSACDEEVILDFWREIHTTLLSKVM